MSQLMQKALQGRADALAAARRVQENVFADLAPSSRS